MVEKETGNRQIDGQIDREEETERKEKLLARNCPLKTRAN